MCLIMYSEISKIMGKQEWLSFAYSRNDDAIGVTDGYSRWTPKGVKELEELLLSLDQDSVVAIHFRFTTQGANSDANTHPFRLKDGSYLMHNGVISKDEILTIASFFNLGLAAKIEYDWRAGVKSDTAILVDVLNKIDPKDRVEVLECISGSRFLLWENDTVNLVNGFVEQNGIHLSNTYSIQPTFWSKKSSTWGNYKNYGWEDLDDEPSCLCCGNEVETAWYFCAWCGVDLDAGLESIEDEYEAFSEPLEDEGGILMRSENGQLVLSEVEKP